MFSFIDADKRLVDVFLDQADAQIDVELGTALKRG